MAIVAPGLYKAQATAYLRCMVQCGGLECTEIGIDGGKCLHVWEKDVRMTMKYCLFAFLALLKSWVSLTFYVCLPVAATDECTRSDNFGMFTPPLISFTSAVNCCMRAFRVLAPLSALGAHDVAA